MAESISFGIYLRNLRESKNPLMSQEMLANKVGKNKMTISQIENGKNAPPQGEFLNGIISALELKAEEEIKIRDLAAIARGAVPSDMLNYFNNSEKLRQAIRWAMKNNLTDAYWGKLIKKGDK